MIADCQAILAYTEGMDASHFFGLHADAVARCLAGLGEKAKTLSSDGKKANPSIPFSSLAKLRDRISHHYEGIDEKIVFEIAKNDVPFLLTQLQKIPWD